MKVDSVVPVFDSAVARPEPDSSRQRDLIQAVAAINRSELFGQNRELTFMLDRDSKRPVMRIVDRDTREVITQIPGEQVLRIAEHLKLLA